MASILLVLDFIWIVRRGRNDAKEHRIQFVHLDAPFQLEYDDMRFRRWDTVHIPHIL